MSMAFQPPSTSTGRVEKAEAFLIRWNHPIRVGPSPRWSSSHGRTGWARQRIKRLRLRRTLAMARRAREIDLTFQLSLNMSPVEIADTHPPPRKIVWRSTTSRMFPVRRSSSRSPKAFCSTAAPSPLPTSGCIETPECNSRSTTWHGYSSLSYLQKLDVDHLKIDREFIMDLPEDEDSLRPLCRDDHRDGCTGAEGHR